MKTVFRLFLVLILGMVIAVAGGVGYVWYQLQSGELRQVLSEQIKTFTGYTVVFEGDFAAEILPQPRLEVGRLVVKGFNGGADIFTADGVKVLLTVEGLWQLAPEVTVNLVNLTNPTVQLITDAQGIANFNNPRVHGSSSGDGGVPFLKKVEDITITGGKFTFRDTPKNQKHTLEDVAFNIKGADLAATQLNLTGRYNNTPFTLNQTLNLTDITNVKTALQASILNANITYDGHIKNLRSSPQLEGAFSLATPNLIPLLDLARIQGTETLPMRTLPVDIKSTIATATNKIALSDLTLELGDLARASGNIQLASRGTEQSVKGKLNTTRLNLNAMGLCNTTAQPAAASTGAPWPTEPLNLSTLRNFNLDLQGTVENFTCGQLPITALEYIVQGQNGTFTLEKLNLTTAPTGSINITGRLETGSSNQGAANITLNALPAESFLSGSLKDQLVLPLSGDIKITFNGKSVADFVQNSNGSIALTANSGQIPPLQSVLDQAAISQLVGINLPQKAAIENVVIDYALESGVLTANTLQVKATDVSLTGTGKIDLAAYAINHTFKPTAVGLGLPLLVQGSLNAPSVIIDVNSPELMGEGIKAILRNTKLDGVRLKDVKLGDQKVGDVLNNVLGITPPAAAPAPTADGATEAASPSAPPVAPADALKQGLQNELQKGLQNLLGN